uniref:Adiposis regulatory factor n=2 Tax=Bos TaxID=9903 RepID=A0ABI0NN42_BOVIN
MASKGLQDLKKQVEGAAQEAVTSAGTAVQQVVDQATEAGQKGLVGLVGKRVDSPAHLHTPPSTVSSADPLSSLLPGEGAPGEANPAWLWFPRVPPSTALSFLPQPWTRLPRLPRKPSTRLLTRPLRLSRVLGKNLAS